MSPTRESEKIMTTYQIANIKDGSIYSHIDTVRGLNVPYTRARAEKAAREINKAHGAAIVRVVEK